MKLAIFDFDDTIVKGQTPDSFCEFALNRLNKNYFQKLIFYLNKFKLMPKAFKIRKKLLLFSLKGTKKNTINKISKEFFNTLIFNKKIINEIKNYKLKNFKIVIVSGAYQSYLRFFKMADDHISNEFNYKKNIFTGILKSKDCLGAQKVNRILKKYTYKDLNSAVFFSDSMTDEPLFRIVKRAYFYDGKIKLLKFN